jgi:hypothetical protein
LLSFAQIGWSKLWGGTESSTLSAPDLTMKDLLESLLQMGFEQSLC